MKKTVTGKIHSSPKIPKGRKLVNFEDYWRLIYLTDNIDIFQAAKKLFKQPEVEMIHLNHYLEDITINAVEPTTRNTKR